jgi:dolichol kinase
LLRIGLLDDPAPAAMLSDMFRLSPLVNNVFIAFLTLVYILIVMEIASYIRESLKMPEASRKTIHIAASSWLLFWPLFDASHWSWRFNVAIPAVYVVKLLYLALILRDPENEDIKNLSRTGNPMEILVGPLQFVLVMMYLGLFQFMMLEATIIMAALGIGDGIAPLVGKKWGTHFYRVPGGTSKTLEGSLGGMLCGTALGCYIYPPLLGFGVLPWRLVAALATVATLGEGTAPFSCDNVVVPTLLHFSFDRLLEAFG